MLPDALKQKIIVIRTEYGERLVAGIAFGKGCFAFADTGWDNPESSGHPFHLIEEEIDPRGDGPWKGQTVELFEPDEEHELVWPALVWRDTHPDWKGSIDRANAALTKFIHALRQEREGRAGEANRFVWEEGEVRPLEDRS